MTGFYKPMIDQAFTDMELFFDELRQWLKEHPEYEVFV